LGRFVRAGEVRWWRAPIKPFKDLSLTLPLVFRLAIYSAVSEIHKAGLDHWAMLSQVTRKGKGLRMVELGGSEEHRCPGKSRCRELDELRVTLGLDEWVRFKFSGSMLTEADADRIPTASMLAEGLRVCSGSRVSCSLLSEACTSRIPSQPNSLLP
jgi:hypothetical protein